MTATSAEVSRSLSADRSALFRNLWTLTLLALCIDLVQHYGIGGRDLLLVLTVATIGFGVSTVSPRPYRLPVYTITSLLGLFLVLGIRDASWLLAIGIVLISICNLPILGSYRLLLLLASAAALAFLRVRWTHAPWSPALWPVLASMFMFRLILYVRALLLGQPTGGPWNTFAYFFMLPNVAFPLFPVVDHQTFQQSQFSRPDSDTYERGILWISRGLVHLLLYRLVNNYFLNDPVEVATLGDLVQFMVGTFLLYLRVSGQFHLAVGILHLFGFWLPETHKLYFLSSGFLDVWRRMNIYWTDFMTRVVFYPTYFRLKRLGPVRATVASTVFVFVMTWFLHSYQWFWLRGDFPLRPQDYLFWGVVGLLVTLAVLRGLSAGRRPNTPRHHSRWNRGFMAVATFMTMCVLWSLWTVPSIADFFWLLGAAANVDIRGLVLLCLLALIVFILTTLAAPTGSHQWKSWTPSATPAVRAATALVLMLAVAQPGVRDMLPSALGVPLKSIQTASPNARDNFEISKSYYDLLDTKDDPGAEPPLTLAQDFANIQSGADTCEGFYVKRWRLRDDGLLMLDLEPSLRLTYPPCWQQPMTFSTNTFGMRDKEYALEKPAATLRIEIFGQSTVMGNGVSDGQTFSQLLENRLNENPPCTRYQRVEVMNFGVDGYTPVQQLTLLEERGLMFSPDIILMTEPGLGRWWMRDYLSNIAFYHLEIPYQPLKQLFEQAGLNAIEHSGIPIPFPSWRNLAKRFGINARMPAGERRSRAARLADAVTSWTWHRLADLAAAHGATGVALALDVPSDDPAVTIPNLGAIRAAQLPVIDLYDVFPPGQRKSLVVSESDDHPNAAGHQLIANRLAKELAPLIQHRCAGGPSK